jgi:hypothetical protein
VPDRRGLAATACRQAFISSMKARRLRPEQLKPPSRPGFRSQKSWRLLTNCGLTKVVLDVSLKTVRQPTQSAPMRTGGVGRPYRRPHRRGHWRRHCHRRIRT